MSEDTQKQVSEETIASIVDAAQNIATDSTAMRKNLVAIAEALHPAISQAGIQFGSGDGTEESIPYGENWQDSEGRYFRVAVRRNKTLQLLIEYTDADIYQCWWDERAEVVGFEEARRDLIEEAIVRLPGFLYEYCAELRRRHQKYADLREKAEQIRAILEA